MEPPRVKKSFKAFGYLECFILLFLFKPLYKAKLATLLCAPMKFDRLRHIPKLEDSKNRISLNRQQRVVEKGLNLVPICFLDSYHHSLF